MTYVERELTELRKDLEKGRMCGRDVWHRIVELAENFSVEGDCLGLVVRTLEIFSGDDIMMYDQRCKTLFSVLLGGYIPGAG